MNRVTNTIEGEEPHFIPPFGWFPILHYIVVVDEMEVFQVRVEAVLCGRHDDRWLLAVIRLNLSTKVFLHLFMILGIASHAALNTAWTS